MIETIKRFIQLKLADSPIQEGYQQALEDVLECIEDNKKLTPMFEITLETVQLEAKEVLSRELTEDELVSVKDGLDNAICETLDYNTLFENYDKANQGREMFWDEFEETYKPIQNPFTEDSPHGNCMFETYGEELEFVQSADKNTVWTQIEEEDKFYIVPGFRICDRIGYLITEEKWKDELDIVTFDEVESEEFETAQAEN